MYNYHDHGPIDVQLMNINFAYGLLSNSIDTISSFMIFAAQITKTKVPLVWYYIPTCYIIYKKQSIPYHGHEIETRVTLKTAGHSIAMRYYISDMIHKLMMQCSVFTFKFK